MNWVFECGTKQQQQLQRLTNSNISYSLCNINECIYKKRYAHRRILYFTSLVLGLRRIFFNAKNTSNTYRFKNKILYMKKKKKKNEEMKRTPKGHQCMRTDAAVNNSSQKTIKMIRIEPKILIVFTSKIASSIGWMSGETEKGIEEESVYYSCRQHNIAQYSAWDRDSIRFSFQFLLFCCPLYIWCENSMLFCTNNANVDRLCS